MEKVTKYAKFEFDKRDLAVVDRLAEKIDQNAGKIFEFFDLSDTDEKVSFHILSLSN